MDLRVNAFLCGIFVASFFGSGLFFFRFYKGTRDRFLLWFGVACWLFALEKAVALIVAPQVENRHALFLIRVAGFVILIGAILRKNAPHRR